jgi:uncharacterized membrane protein YhaH (DUF805 family)
MSIFLDVFTNHFADFEGRARRREFWGFYLFGMLIYVGALVLGMVLDVVAGTEVFTRVLTIVAGLAIVVPFFGVAVRRLHDAGYSGWFLLIGLIPIVGGLFLLFLYCKDSQPGLNEYGENPKSVLTLGLT